MTLILGVSYHFYLNGEIIKVISQEVGLGLHFNSTDQRQKMIIINFFVILITKIIIQNFCQISTYVEVLNYNEDNIVVKISPKISPTVKQQIIWDQI